MLCWRQWLVMIPKFDADGNLPPGIHEAEWPEFALRFGGTEKRQMLLQGLKEGLLAFWKASCPRVYIDGSFVTNKLNPGDYDACWEDEGVDLAMLDPILLTFDNQRFAQKAKYLGEFFPAWDPAEAGGRTFLDFFQTDRDGNPKGIVAFDLRRFTT